MIFTGGYDTTQDNDAIPDNPKSDSYGNALYVVDADTGQKLWMAGPTGDSDANLTLSTMTNSLPGDPALIDIGGDGLIDTIFTADTRGQIFRFDIKAGNAGASDFATGGRVAALGGTDASNNRRFYNQPDVALIKERGGDTYFTLSIGSGYRGHPLSESALDRFYVIRDKNVYAAPATYTSITESNLVDVSSVNLTSAEAQSIQSQINTKRGEIDTLNANEATARANLASYQASIGYTDKLNTLVGVNNSINQKQAAIDTILRNDPYVAAHATESSSQTQSHSLVVAAQSALAQLNGLNTTSADASSFKASELDSTTAGNIGNLQARITAGLSDASLSSQYNAILAKQNQITAAKAVDSDTTTLESELATLNTNYENSAAYGVRNGLIQNLSAINGKISQIAELQAAVVAAYNQGNTAEAASKLADLSSAKSALNALLPSGLPAAPAGTTSSALLAANEAQTQATLDAVSSPLVTQSNLVTSLESERVTLAGQASSLQADLQALANRAYDTASNVLNATQLAAATAADTTPPLTQFEAYNYLIEQARAAAASDIPTKRAEINALYAQLTPGDSYTPNPTLLPRAAAGSFVSPAARKCCPAP